MQTSTKGRHHSQAFGEQILGTTDGHLQERHLNHHHQVERDRLHDRGHLEDLLTEVRLHMTRISMTLEVNQDLRKEL